MFIINLSETKYIYFSSLLSFSENSVILSAIASSSL